MTSKSRGCNWRHLIFLTSLVLTVQVARAQWSTDAGQNFMVCDTLGSQELPKIAATSDGGCYISWFDTRASAYRVYMQRLNAQGVKQWEPNGLLISSNPQSTSLVDWDLAVDDSDNAIVVFTDQRNGTQINPFAYKIGPQGAFLWGANGVQLSNATTVFQADPKVAKTSDGSFVFVWPYGSSPNQVAMQRLDAAGTKQWGNDPILISGGAEQRWRPSLVASDNGSVILLYAAFTGSTISPQNYKLLTRKVSPAGTTLWTDTVYALGRVSGFFVPKIFPDGSNGALYVWHDERGGANSTSYVQRFTSAGTPLFPLNGSASSTLAGRLHNDAWVAHASANNETYMFWYETNSSTQSIYGVYGQKFSSNGTRQWADSGVAFRPFGGGQPSFVRCFARDSAAVVFYLDGVTVTTNLVRGFKVDRNGTMLWGGSILDVSSVSSGKGRLGGAFTASGNSLLAWADKRLDGNGIYAQELSLTGNLGVVTGLREMIGSEFPVNFSLEQNYPNPFNPVTTITYNLPVASRVSIKIYNILGQEVKALLDDVQQLGFNSTVWDATNTQGNLVSTGVYFYRIRASSLADPARSFTQVKKMMVQR